ncbi:hypothetical protein ACMFMG_008358 [Clarireedia jacksonii]
MDLVTIDQLIERPLLSNPERQIRLLYLRPGEPTDIIQGHLSSWDLDCAPPFIAISYTWGPAEPRLQISIGERKYFVRKNCAYALWQARFHKPSSWIWIDSLCIDQNNHTEKNLQVTIMGKIYAKSLQVLACIGPADESSDYIFKVLLDMDKIIQDFPENWYDLDEDEAKRVWNPPSGETLIVELFNHWNRFSDRAYFSRVWVVQELLGGLGRTKVLCGTSSTDWELLGDLSFRMEACFSTFNFISSHLHPGESPARDIYSMVVQLQAFDSTEFNFPQILEESRDCQDIRDRIYGTLNLIDWERFHVPRPVPDYNISRVLLAVEVLRRTLDLNFRLIGFATVPALEIAIDDLIAEGFVSIHGVSNLDKVPSGSTLSRSWYDSVQGAVRIEGDVSMGLHVNLRKGKDYGLDSTKAEDVFAAWDDGERIGGYPKPFGGKTPVKVFTDSTLSLLACPDTRAGDILLHVTYAGILIIRPADDATSYIVVGKAILVNGYKMLVGNTAAGSAWTCECWSKLPRKSHATACIYVRFHVSDIQALCLGTGTVEDQPKQSLYQASLNIPEPGTLIQDITDRNWRSDQAIVPFSEACERHCSVDTSRPGLRVCIEAETGPYLKIFK